MGDNYDAPVEGLDPNLALIVKELAQHPEFSKSGDISLPKMGDATPTPSQGQGTLSPKQNEGVADPRAEKERRQKLMATAQQLGVEAGGAPPEQMQLSMPVSGNGWFETYFGKPAETLVKDLRMARRTHKDFKVDIDDAITAVRLVKRMEVDETLKAIPWSGNHENSMRNLGLSDRDLTALRKYATPREVSLRQACVMWERADSTIERLNKHEDVWGSVEQAEWLEALQLKKDAKSSGRIHCIKLTISQRARPHGSQNPFISSILMV